MTEIEHLNGDYGSISINGIQYIIKKWEIIKEDRENWKGWAIVPSDYPSRDSIKSEIKGNGIFRTPDDKRIYCGEIVAKNFIEEESKIVFKGASSLRDCTS